MSRSFQVFLGEPFEIGTILEGQGWQRTQYAPLSAVYEPDQFRLEGREWFADIWGPSPMSWEDAPPQATALLAGIGWHIEISLEGSEAGLDKVMRAVRAMAKAGRGVIADENSVWRPGSTRRTRWTRPVPPLRSENELLSMTWWTLDHSTTTQPGATAFVETLQRVLPEAVPVRWGDFEPFPLSLEKEGLAGLARYVQAAADGLVLTKVKPPFAELTIHPACLLRHPPTPEGPMTLSIEAGGSILNQVGFGRQLAAAFREISRVFRPFYAEARLAPNTDSEDGWDHERQPYVSPVSGWNWNGFPRVAPMAMVVGPPYTSHWRTDGGTHEHGMIFYSSEAWPHPPHGGVPIAVDELLQEFDPYAVVTDTSSSGRHPTRQPALWPFETRTPP
jgi:hypothetical protein